MLILALTGHVDLFVPRSRRFRLFSAAGQFVTTGRRRVFRFTRHWRRAGGVITALRRLALLPNLG